MPTAANPEILSPRSRSGATAFDDEHLDILSHLLDDWFRIPGTAIRFGLDGIVGFIPGIGDVIAGIASCIIIFAAWMRGVAYITLARMIANWGIEVLIGAVPILGNLFDIAWRANRRNYALLTGSLADPQGTRRRSGSSSPSSASSSRPRWSSRSFSSAGSPCTSSTRLRGPEYRQRIAALSCRTAPARSIICDKIDPVGA